MSQVRLKVGEVPRYPFVGHPVELNVQLIKESRMICGEDNALAVKLCCVSEDGMVECQDDIWEIIDCENIPIIPKSGSMKFRVVIKETSMRYENQDFVFEISLASSKRYDDVPAVCSDPMFVVNHRLVIENSIPALFYKDLGGKESCVEFTVSLRDHNNEVVRNRRVILAPVLLYQNGRQVPDQSILSIVGDSRQLVMEPGEGSTHLKMRINEVSRSHQKQLFVIKICPDTITHPLTNDIGPDCTTPVDVMSKPRPSKHTQGVPGGGGMGKRALEGDASERAKDKAARIMEYAEGQLPATVIDVESNVSNHPPCSPHQAAVLFHNLSEWARMTIEEVAHMQWRQIGYEVVGDGSQPAQPLFERKNPNAAIAVLVDKYNTFALPSLNLLRRDVFSHTSTGAPQFSRSLSHTEGTATGSRGQSGRQADTKIESDYDMELVHPPSLTAQHSLISLPDDWPTLDRITTADMESLSRNLS